jgi:hypothetical protein
MTQLPQPVHCSMLICTENAMRITTLVVVIESVVQQVS